MSVPPKTPKLFLRLLSSQKDNAYSGDIEELFHFQVETIGPNRARRWYFWEVLKAVPRFVLESIRWRLVMFKCAIKIILRNLQRHKGHSFINISGLIIGLSVCMLTFLYIRFELSFDKFHKNAPSIYRIIAHSQKRDIHFAATEALIAETLKQDFSEVRYAARVRRRGGYLKYEERMFSETTIHYVDPDYLKMFTFPLAAGDANYLEEPFALFISQEMAEKYFKDKNPIGCVLSLNNQYEFIVRGVLANIPDNSSIRFDMLASMSTLNTLWGKKFLNRWISHDFQTYVMLEPKADAGRFEEKLKRFIIPGDEKNPKRELFYSQPLNRIHFRSGLRFDDILTTDYRSIYLLAVISIVILLLAGLNYTTLATARATRRTREIGVRKVVGASQSGLACQFLGESILAALIAFIFSLVLVKSILPAFNQLMSRNLSLSVLSDLPGFLGLTLLVGFAAGIYPAMYLSSFQPAQVIRGTLLLRSKSSSLLRKSLVVTQFVITIAILACLLFINKQIHFLMQKSMSRFENPVLNIYLSDGDLRSRHEPLLQAFLQASGVLDGTASSHHPLGITGGTGINWEGEDRGHFTRFTRVDHNYFDFYGLNLKYGRAFSKDISTDKTEAVIVNETAARDSLWENPVGKRCNIEGEGVVVGMVKDFHYRPLHIKVEPLTIRYISTESFLGGASYISLKIDSQDIPGTLVTLEKTWQQFSPYFPFMYTFLDNTIDGVYRAERQLSRNLTSFTYIAIFLACLGLFGLTSFTVERRTKEIGIRKVMGASKHGILIMLTKDILVWVGLAIVAAYPLAYYAVHEWLKRFAYRIDINPGPFIIATLSSLLIALLAMSFQSIKAAAANPVDSLRYE